jgi:RNA polymerase sigma-70 factor (ECF subfamily)
MESTTQEQPDEQLVEAARNGHLESFGILYERYHSSMSALAYSVLADRELAYDAAQEVFVIACRDLRALKHEDKFGAWLAGICRNVARGMLRTKSRTITSNFQQEPKDTDAKEQRRDVVRRAVWQLRTAERELIVMRYYDGLSQAQISEVLDISASAVNGRLVRAKRKIEKYLKRSGFTGEDYGTV